MRPSEKLSLWTRSLTVLGILALVAFGCGNKAPETSATPEGPPEATQDAAETAGKSADAAGGSGSIETIGEGADQISLVRVKGDRYQMGYWYGKLLADQIAETWKLVQKMAAAEGLPDQLFDIAADRLWNKDLYDTEGWTKELEGVAAGCTEGGHPEITFRVLQKVASVPDLSEAGCSLFVAWGNATAGDEVYQMRNLDWAMDTGFQDYPVVIIYEPTDGGRKHAIVGFAGVLGAVVGGMNEDGLAVSEIMGHFCDEETLDGMPFPFLLRDVLYYDDTMADGLARMKAANRTNQYHYALGDPNAPDVKGRLLFTSKTRFDEYVDGQTVSPHPCEGVTPFHEPLDDVVYWKAHNGKTNEVVYTALKERYGKLDAKGAIEVAQAACVDGTLVSIIYHNSGNALWVAFAEGATPAPRQQYVEVKLD